MAQALDITAAVISYLQSAMGGSLGVTATNQAVWADYAPDVPLPYCVVTEGESENLDFQSNDPSLAGYYTSVVANGMIFVSFIATSKAQCKALVRECVRKLVDTVVTLVPADGVTLEIRPQSVVTVQLDETGPGTPTVFRRTVVVRYTQQFPV